MQRKGIEIAAKPSITVSAGVKYINMPTRLIQQCLSCTSSDQKLLYCRQTDSITANPVYRVIFYQAGAFSSLPIKLFRVKNPKNYTTLSFGL